MWDDWALQNVSCYRLASHNRVQFYSNLILPEFLQTLNWTVIQQNISSEKINRTSLFAFSFSLFSAFPPFFCPLAIPMGEQAVSPFSPFHVPHFKNNNKMQTNKLQTSNWTMIQQNMEREISWLQSIPWCQEWGGRLSSVCSLDTSKLWSAPVTPE